MGVTDAIRSGTVVFRENDLMEAGWRIREYELQQKISEGGMGEVWQARHIHLERRVAIKVMYEKLMSEAGFGERFLQEARAMSALQHPHILGIIDFFTDSGAYYLIMPYVDGGSLRDKLAAAGGRLAVSDTLRLARPLLQALHYAHGRGVVHRDVKPSNILLDREGQPFLVDFGIALIAGQERRTMTGTVIGSPHYMSPEQITRPRDVDARADQYSMGCVLYEMLTGRPPFIEDNYAAVFVAHCTQPPRSPRDFNPALPPALCQVVLRALEKEPGLRFPGCRELLEGLESAGCEPQEGTRLLPNGEGENGRAPAAEAPARPAPDAGEEGARAPAAGAVGPMDILRVPTLQEAEAMPPEEPTLGGDALPGEAQVQFWIQRIASGHNLPAFARSIHQLLVSSRREDVSLRQLANLILKDLSLTSKILRVVNSVHYNRFGKPILSISHAVMVMGSMAIRDLAAGMLLFENFNRKTPGVRELLLISHLTASYAGQIAHLTAFPNQEAAYLGGMFSSFGELVVACFMPKQYAQIMEVMKNRHCTARQASRQVLQFTYDEIGRELLRLWRLPEQIAYGMDNVERLPADARGEDDLLHLISAFSSALSFALFRLHPGEGHRQVHRLLEKFGEILQLKEENLDSMLKTAAAETKEIFSAAGLNVDTMHLEKHIANVMAGSGEAAEIILLEEYSGTTSEYDSGENLVRLIQEVESILESDEGFDLNDIIMIIIEAIYRGGRFDRVLFAMSSGDRRDLIGRMGLGEEIEDFIESFSFPISLLSGPVGLVILKRQEVFVETVGGTRFQSSAFIRRLEAFSFGMIPVVVRENVIGCFYFDRRRRPLGLTDTARRQLVRLVGDFSRFLSRKHGVCDRLK